MADSFDVDFVAKNRPAEETLDDYSKWADKYEQDMLACNWNGPKEAAKFFFDFSIDKNAKILDIGAGTGLLGELLQKECYSNVDCLDGNEEMLKRAMEKKLYKNYIVAIIKEGKKTPIENNSYDALIMSGVFLPGHLGPSAFPELIRITKPGGLICWSMRVPELFSSSEFDEEMFDTKIKELQEQGMWEQVEKRTIETYVMEYRGCLYAMRVK